MAITAFKLIKLFKVLCEEIQQFIKSSYQSDGWGELKVHLQFCFEIAISYLNMI